MDHNNCDAIIERFRQHHRGELPPDEGYYPHLAECLKEAALVEELNSLFADETWMQARLAHDGYEYDGYIRDLEVGWQVAEEELEAQIAAGDQPPAALVQIM